MSGTEIAGRYALESELGGGGGGRVYRAFDRRERRHVALKLLHAHPEGGRDLEREALRALRHPHLVSVLDAGSDAGRAYVVHELVPGGTLADLPRPLTEGERESLAEQMLEGLAFLHAHGILHGDVKPENVFVQAREPAHFKLGDFGLARRSVDASAGMTRGSPAFMPPEIVRGDPDDERSDLYSLGVTLYECTFGVLPFASDSVREVLLRHLTEEPTELRRNAAAGGRWTALLRALLAKDPASRPAGAREALALWRGEAAAVPRRSLRRLGILVAREAQLTALETALGGETAIACVDGPAGTGKTRLLRELVVRAELRGRRAVAWDAQGVWGPAQDLAGSEAREASEVGEASPPGESRWLAESRAAAVLRQLGPGPWLLVVDDVETTPGWFVESLAFLLRDVASEPVPGRLVCVAGRGGAGRMARAALEAGGLPAPLELEIGPWSRDSMRAAASALLGARTLEASLVDLLEEATGGVPAEVEAACAALVEEDLLRFDAQGALTAAAETTSGMLAAAARSRGSTDVSHCELEELAILRALALVDAPAPAELLHAIHGAPAGALLESLQRAGLARATRVGGRLRFAAAHAGVRRAALEALGEEQRRALHDAIATSLELRPDLLPEESAELHRARGGDWRRGRAATDALSGAGARPERLRAALESLLEIWPAEAEPALRLEAELELLDALLRLGAYDEARTRAERALQDASEGEPAGRLRNRLAEALLSRGDTLEALSALDAPVQGRAALEAEVLRARALYQLARHDEALDVCEKLEPRLVHDAALADRVSEVRVLVLREHGRFDEARARLELSLHRHERSGARRAQAADLTHLGLVEFGQGRMPEAEACFERALGHYQACGDRFGLARLSNCLGAVAAETGRYTRARELFRGGLDLCRKLGETENTNYLLGNLGQLLFFLGRYREALEHADQGVELAGRRGMQTNVVRIRIIRAGILAALGQDERCRAELESLLEGSGGELYEAQVLLLHSDLTLRQGEIAPVHDWLERAGHILSERSVRDEQVIAGLLRARLAWATGRREAAIAAARQAAAEARRLGLAWLGVESEAWAAEMLLDSGRDDEAASTADSGLEVARGLGILEAAWRFERVLGRVALRHGEARDAVRRYEASVRILRDMTAELGAELSDAYLMRADRLRVFFELAEVRAAVEAHG